MSARSPSSALGEAARHAQDEAFADRPLPAMPAVASPRAVRGARARVLAPLAVAAIAACALGAWRLRAPRPSSGAALVASAPSVALDGVEMPRLEQWIVAALSPRQLRFADEGAVTVLAGARARVLSVAAEGAHVQLERGALEVAVVHRSNTRWRFDAGPYSVRVTGTRFRITWDPPHERFSIEMREGSVALTGPSIEGERRVLAGARWSSDASIEPTLSPVEPIADAAVAPPAEPPARAPRTPIDRAAGASHHEATGADRVARARDEWVELARNGAFDEAVVVAERAGIDAIVRGASADDLVLLADASRFSGRSSLARSLYLAVRARSARGGAATRAAFALGRLAVEQGSSWQDAAQWFELVTQEQPQSPLAREALGRAIEAHRRAGRLDRARQLAAQYVQQHPDGPAASLAQSLLR